MNLPTKFAHPQQSWGGGGGGLVSAFPEKSVTKVTVQRYWHYEGVGWRQISRKKLLRNT